MKNVLHPSAIEKRRKFQLFKRYLQNATSPLRKVSRMQETKS